MIRPLGDRIVVKPAEAISVSKGGIYLPESSKEKPAEGIVMAVGSGKIGEDGKIVPLEVSVGDKILYAKFAGNPITTEEGEDLLILREDEVFAVAE